MELRISELGQTTFDFWKVPSAYYLAGWCRGHDDTNKESELDKQNSKKMHDLFKEAAITKAKEEWKDVTDEQLEYIEVKLHKESLEEFYDFDPTTRVRVDHGDQFEEFLQKHRLNQWFYLDDFEDSEKTVENKLATMELPPV